MIEKLEHSGTCKNRKIILKFLENRAQKVVLIGEELTEASVENGTPYGQRYLPFYLFCI